MFLCTNSPRNLFVNSIRQRSFRSSGVHAPSCEFVFAFGYAKSSPLIKFGFNVHAIGAIKHCQFDRIGADFDKSKSLPANFIKF